MSSRRNYCRLCIGPCKLRTGMLQIFFEFSWKRQRPPPAWCIYYCVCELGCSLFVSRATKPFGGVVSVDIYDMVPTIPPFPARPCRWSNVNLCSIYLSFFLSIANDISCAAADRHLTPCRTPHPTTPPARPPAAFHSTYQLGKIIGEGAFSQVRSATVTRSGPNKGVQVAVKCIERTNLPKEDEEDLLEEVRHTYIIYIMYCIAIIYLYLYVVLL